MVRPIAKILLPLLALVLLCVHAASADTSSIEVDLDTLTVNPEFPAINIWSADTIVIKIKGKTDLADDDIFTTIDVLTPPPASAMNKDSSIYEKKNEFYPLKGRNVTLTVDRCENAPDGKCPAAVITQETSSAVVYTPPRSIVVKIHKKGNETEVNGKKTFPLTSLIGFPIQAERKPFALGFSAGFAGFGGLADRRFRLMPIEGESEMATLARASDKNLTYQIAAFAHYMPYRWQGTNGPAIGLATDVPVEDITFMLGWSFAARTLLAGNTGYLTVGVAYAKRNRLRPEFQEGGKVAADLSLDTVTEKTYGVGAFISISFGFFGGEQRFKGVFPAGGSSGGGS